MFFVHAQKAKTKIYISWEQKELLNKKAFFIIFEGLSLKQIINCFLEGKSSTLRFPDLSRFSLNFFKNPFSKFSRLSTNPVIYFTDEQDLVILWKKLTLVKNILLIEKSQWPPPPFLQWGAGSRNFSMLTKRGQLAIF